MKAVKLTILICLSAFLFTGCGESVSNANVAKSVNKPGATPTATIDELASGKKAYETNCMICHKADGTGGTVSVEGRSMDVDDLTSEKIKAFSDEKIIGYMIKGIPSEGMPSFKDKLSEGAMRDVVKFIRVEIQKQ